MIRYLAIFIAQCLLYTFIASPCTAALDLGEVGAAPEMVTEIILLDKDSNPIPFGGSAEFEAKTFPEGRTVIWSVKPKSGSKAAVTTVENGSFITLTPTQESEEGWIIIEASINDEQKESAEIYVGCQTCSSGDCSFAGSGFVTLGSIDIKISLGKDESGMLAGYLLIRADKPDADLFSPKNLEISSLSPSVTPLYGDTLLKQIITPQAFIIVEPSSSSAYEILFYNIEDRGDLVDGFYQLKPYAEPTSAWRIENLDTASQTFKKARVTEFRLGAERRYEYTYSEESNSWNLASGNGLKTEKRNEYFNEIGDRVERIILSDDSNKIAAVKEKTYRTFDWGEELIEETTDPDGDHLTTTYEYNTGAGPGYSKRARRINPDGSWVRYQYDNEGRILKTITPFLDVPVAGNDALAKVKINSYRPLPGDSALEGDRSRPRTVTTEINGIVAAKTFHHYSYNGDAERVEIFEQCTTQDCEFGNDSNLRTVTTYFPKSIGPESQKLKSQLTPDDQLTTYLYESGNFSSSPDPERAVFTAGKGSALRLSKIHGTAKSPDGIALQTMKETSISDEHGNEVMQEISIKTESGFERVSWSYNTYNNQGRLIETLYSNHTRTEAAWSCCGKQSSTDIYGITTSYQYDDLKRTTASINEATGVRTEFSYDAAGRQLSSVESTGGLARTQSSRFDLSGRLVEKISPTGLKTTFHYDRGKTTITYPGGGEKITETHLDGRLKSITGSAVVNRFYQYGINPDGSQWVKEIIAKEDSPRFVITTRDMIGRIIQTERPGYEASQFSRYHYNRIGQLVKITNSGLPDNLIEYDELGRQVRNGFDLNGSSRLDLASMDRIQETSTLYIKEADGWWKEQSLALYTEEGSGTPVTVSVVRTRRSGWDNNLIAEQRAIDIHGNETRTTDILDRYNRVLTRRIKYPDSEIVAEQVYRNSQIVSSQGKTGHVTRFDYDALERQISVTDPRIGTSYIHYNDNHQVDYSTDAAGNRTSYLYDTGTGQRTTVINPLGKQSFFRLNLKNQLTHSWGDVPYPVEYRYNEYNELVELFTFRTDDDWSQQRWPAGGRSGDKTSWNYQESTGLLLAKRDASGTGNDYSYSRFNRLKTRTDARNITTAYSYSPMAELVKTNYSDDTPDIIYTYDRTGRTSTITDAVGVRFFSYTDGFQPDLETIKGPFPARIARTYDNLGREQTISFNSDYQLLYRYDKTGRFSQLDWQANGNKGSTLYNYLENADLPAGYQSDNISVRHEYEPNRNLRTEIVNSSPEKLISRYEYQYDRLGRRISEKQSGETFQAPSFNLYGYNSRNEIESSARFIGNDLNDQTRPLADKTRFYQYDAIGNRMKFLEGNQPSIYRTNNLNQYDQIDNQSLVDMTYDPAGNLIQSKDGLTDSRYIYNAENRLIAHEPARPKENDIKVTYTYDYMGRRADKKTFKFSKNGWEPASHTYFIYDGWNLLSEIDLNSKRETNYIWGLDISGSMHGAAGGVGGLLTRIDHNQNPAHYTYDNRGNISQLISQDGTILSAYEYDPYGKPLSTRKPDQKDPNPFRFSTKYYDHDLNLYDYGYRHYSPAIGRWLSKDPIAELGGQNLYSFAKNSINNIDSNGLYVYDMHYVAVFATLRAAGKSAQDAWEIAYYSSYPDMDKRYDATSNFLPTLFGSEKAIKYQEYLHSLNGKDLDEIEILRKCASCMIQSDAKELNLQMQDSAVDGILLHLLGDTYGHLKINYLWENGEIVGYETIEEAYSSGIGHLFDVTFPDMVAYRPSLANDFLESVFNIFGHDAYDEMKIIHEIISDLQHPKFPTQESTLTALSNKLMTEEKLRGLSREQRTFNPIEHNVQSSLLTPTAKPVNQNDMIELLDTVIRCSEGAN